MRYIEDIFFVWTGTLQELNKFKLEINQVDPSIKFHFDYSKDKVSSKTQQSNNLRQTNVPPPFLEKKQIFKFISIENQNTQNL